LTHDLQELEFLTDSSVISPQQLSSILAQLPAQTPLHAPLYTPITGSSPTPPTNLFSNINLNEKANYGVATNPAPPPPAYASGPQILSIAAALYAYTPTDAGDLALQPNDRIQVTEHMNNDCKPCARPFSEASWILIQIHRVARAQRTNRSRRHIPKKLCQHCGREEAVPCFLTIDGLRQHAVGC
jgi:hypothetical protein